MEGSKVTFHFTALIHLNKRTSYFFLKHCWQVLFFYSGANFPDMFRGNHPATVLGTEHIWSRGAG